MSLLFSLISGVAGGIARAVRGAGEAADAQQAQAAGAREARARGALDQARAGNPRGSFAQHYQAQIAKATDSDGDGVISQAELREQVRKGGGSTESADTLYKAMDKNRDGKVTVDEFKDSLPVPTTAVAQQILAMIQAHHAAMAANAANNGGASNGTSNGTSNGPGAVPIGAGNAGAPGVTGIAAGAAAGQTDNSRLAAALARAPAIDAAQVLARLAAQVS